MEHAWRPVMALALALEHAARAQTQGRILGIIRF